MLLKIFKGNNPGAIVLITLIIIAIWVSAFIHPSGEASVRFDNSPMPLYGFLLKATGTTYLIRTIVAFILSVVLIFLIMNFNTTNFFINERTYLPALMYALIQGLFPEYQTLNPVIPAAVFLMIAVMRIIDSYRKPGLANNFFDAGIFISIGSLFYANLIWFGLLVIIGMVLIRTVNLSEITIAVVGFITPYFLLFGAYYVLGMDLQELYNVIVENLMDRTDAYQFSRLTIAVLILSSVIAVISIGYLLSHLSNKKVKSRQTFSLLIWTFLISVAVYYILPSVSVEMAWISGIPVSYFLTHYFVFNKRKFVPDIFLSILLLSVFFIQFFYLK